MAEKGMHRSVYRPPWGTMRGGWSFEPPLTVLLARNPRAMHILVVGRCFGGWFQGVDFVGDGCLKAVRNKISPENNLHSRVRTHR